MSPSAQAFHRHARAVVDHELGRARGQLSTLPCDRRLAVEEVSARIAVALVDGVLEQAHDEPSLAVALASIYGDRLPELRAVSSAAD